MGNQFGALVTELRLSPDDQTSNANEMSATNELPHCARPCANCPWRRDSPVGEFPADRYQALRATAGRSGHEAGLGAPVFACHKTEPGSDRACAGWLAVVGIDHLGIRLAIAMGRLPASVLRPRSKWPELFASYDEMAERNGLRA